MPLLDLALPVIKALRDLPRDRYPAAMWIIASEMRDIYVGQDLMTIREQRMMTRTLSALRSTVAKGRTVRRTPGMRALTFAWTRAARSEQGMTGTMNARFTFRDVSCELAGAWDQHVSAGRVTIPFTDIPWVTHIPTGRGFRVLNNRTIDENGITAGLLCSMQATCSAVRDLPGPVTVADLDQIRRTAFGAGWVPVEPKEADLERYRLASQAREERRANASRRAG